MVSLSFLFKRHDAIITPTEYSKNLIAGYGIKHPIYAVSNGIDLSRYIPNSAKRRSFTVIILILNQMKKLLFVLGSTSCARALTNL